jgi:LacI family transcriptional regulator
MSRSGGAAGARQLLSNTSDVTAIVTLSDIMAIGVIAELRARRLRVPSDISVTGFDDIAVAADLAPALTTVRLGMVDIGSTAVRLATRAQSESSQQITTNTELIVRSSTGVPLV